MADKRDTAEIGKERRHELTCGSLFLSYPAEESFSFTEKESDAYEENGIWKYL